MVKPAVRKRGTTIVTIPVLILTYALQRYLKAGYLAGAIKEPKERPRSLAK